MKTIRLNKNKFEQNQLEQILIGLKQDLDVSIYAKPEYNLRQMELIRLGLKQGLDVSIYAKPEYDI